MKVAVEGCCHGELDNIYAHIADLESKNEYKVDLLLICGDFQAVRNWRDLQCMAVPDKYKQLQTFYKYYTGEKKAPILTIVIGGNHEASNYMWELYHGGWLAPNIYFLGHAGCVQVNGIRIAGASGIFKGYNFSRGMWLTGYFETMPYDKEAIRSIYHIREFNVRKLSLLSSPQIFLSHDWPVTIDQHGDYRTLIRQKSHFRQEINSGTLGSPPLMGLLRTLKPEWWFSAHLHVRFEATVVHGDPEGNADTQPTSAAPPKVANPDEIAIDDDEFDGDTASAPTVTSSDAQTASSSTKAADNPDEIKLDDEEEDVAPQPEAQPPPSITRFLALDKCLPRRKFLEVIDISPDSPTLSSPPNAPPTLSFDPEWLAILRAFDPWFSLTREQRPFPDESEAREMVNREMAWVEQHLLRAKPQDQNDHSPMFPVSDIQQFVMTAPGPGSEGADKFKQPPLYPNPQTDAFCKMLEIPNRITGTV
ncbi:DBR1-domain-containing protein [Dendrothele bispora CBS 962.96]|uniref:DBR1-domain-containing protein n=1 Tax=Dendrothele bispora (strain CBS 962.96) TaxID=1314807 RepID=A0A4S8LIS1_DENBC|nr:DBR1-domain-containing protein [Dendrothele bispora CBS 962.96]